MPLSVHQQFIAALKRLESDNEIEALLALFAPDCEVGNIVVPERFHGPEGAREFWLKYRASFSEMKSSFRNEIVSAGRIALEWTTEVTSAAGSTFDYEGVSIMESAGQKITRFRAYFDAGALARQMESQSAATA